MTTKLSIVEITLVNFILPTPTHKKKTPPNWYYLFVKTGRRKISEMQNEMSL